MGKISGNGIPGGLPLIIRFSRMIMGQTIIVSGYVYEIVNNPHPRHLKQIFSGHALSFQYYFCQPPPIIEII